MNNNQKHKIAEQLKTRMEQQGMSQPAVANSIGGISAPTIHTIIHKKWIENEKLISDKMWNRVAAWLGGIDQEWVLVEEDDNFKRITNIARRAQRTSHARAIVGEPGQGKSATLRYYANTTQNAWYIQCAEYWTKKVFLGKLKQVMGLQLQQQSIPEMIEEIISHVNKSTSPLIIVDEFDKLKDGVMNLFNCLYNETLNQCGYVISGAPNLAARINKGVRLNKQGYKEIYSRVGGEFLPLHDLNEKRIAAICRANGINNPEYIKEVINSANNDLRRVKNMIDTIKLRIEKDHGQTRMEVAR